MEWFQEMRRLAQILDFLDYSEQRSKGNDGEQFVEDQNQRLKTTAVVKRGIADLDFDPFYYLGSGVTSPEEWAVEKGKQQ